MRAVGADAYGSLNGNTYFVGFLGKTKLVLLQDMNAECAGTEVARWTFTSRRPRSGLPVPLARSGRAEACGSNNIVTVAGCASPFSPL